MPTQTTQRPPVVKDEIDLRELFVTIWRHKTFIILFTLFFTIITVIIVYRMPKYYKTTTVIEVKPKTDNKSGGLSLGSLGGAAALLGLGGMGASSSTAKDAAMLSMYRTNHQVLDSVDYNAQYFVTEKFRPLELPESNCSIVISGLQIYDYKHFGMEVTFKPINKKLFALSLPSKIPFMSENLGTFAYDTPIKTHDFACAIHHKSNGATPTRIILNGNKHFIFNSIISKNLSTEVGSGDKKAKVDLPFVTISYLDTLPTRGERYVQDLVGKYVRLSIGDELDDINISLSSINQQIEEMHAQARSSAKHYQSYKSKNAILSPEAQAKVLIQEKALVDQKLLEFRHKLSLVNQLISGSKKRSNIDTMAPALSELGDKVTAEFIGKLQELQAEESALKQEFTSAYPKLKSVRSQIRNLRAKIRASLISLRKILSDEVTMMKKEKQRYLTRLKQAPKLETGLAPLMRDYKLYETMYTYLLQKRSSLELKRAEALSRFRTIDPIYTNHAPAKPNKALIAIVGLITSLIFSIFIVFFIEFLKGDNGSETKEAYRDR